MPGSRFPKTEDNRQDNSLSVLYQGCLLKIYSLIYIHPSLLYMPTHPQKQRLLQLVLIPKEQDNFLCLNICALSLQFSKYSGTLVSASLTHYRNLRQILTGGDSSIRSCILFRTSSIKGFICLLK